MVEVGSLQIGGSINTEAIESGLTRVGKGFDVIDSKSSGLNSDFERMNNSVKSLNMAFGVMAIAGAGTIIALAKGAPATAAAMAQIGLGSMKLKFAIGEALKDEFEWFAEKLNWFAGWVQEHPDLFSFVTKSVLILAGAFAVFKVGGVIGAGISALTSVASGLIAIVSSPAFLLGIGALASAAAAFAYIRGLEGYSSQATEGFYKTAGIDSSEVTQAYTQGYQGTIYPGMTQGSYTGGNFSQINTDFIGQYNSSTTRNSMGLVLKDRT